MDYNQIFKITRTHSRSIYRLAMVALMAPDNFLGILFGKILPSNGDLHLDNIVSARNPYS